MGSLFKIYVGEKEIYSGGLTEVPGKFRDVIIEDISYWAGSLGKRGLNELLYSHLRWYEEKGMFCDKCDTWCHLNIQCPHCGGMLNELYVYDRDKGLDMLLTCIGIITRIEVLD
ncbi:MAG TPA: hypothetical protein VGA95_14360 [Thermodesulfobacteriota bacterium]|jgi:hypothetical protein